MAVRAGRDPRPGHKVIGVGFPEGRADFELRLAQAKREPKQDAVRRTEVALRVTLVTLLWLVSVSLLLGWGLTEPKGQGGATSSALAAVLAVLLPFVAAVIATKNRRFVVGGVYVVLTLAMVLPALGIARAGG
jgi:hypothetical protein